MLTELTCSGAQPRCRQLAGQRLDGLDAAALGHRQHPALDGVGGQGNVVMSARARGLVDGEFAHCGEVGLRQRQLHVALADRGYPVPALADQSRRRGEGHLLAQHQHQRLEQQGEARQFARPRRLDLAYRAVGQPHPRHAYLQEALVLEEIQMPVALGHRVVDRMLAVNPRHREATARRKVHADRERARLRIEIRPGHEPRGADPQRRFKQLFSHRNQPQDLRRRTGVYPLRFQQRLILNNAPGRQQPASPPVAASPTAYRYLLHEMAGNHDVGLRRIEKRECG